MDPELQGTSHPVRRPAGGARTPGWVQRPPRGAQGGTTPPVWWDGLVTNGPGKVSPRGQVAQEPSARPLPQPGDAARSRREIPLLRLRGWQSTFQPSRLLTKRQWAGRAGPLAEGALSLGSRLRPTHLPPASFPWSVPSLGLFTLGCPWEEPKPPPTSSNVPVPPLCSADRPGDPRVRQPGTPGPLPADSAATQHRHQTTGVAHAWLVSMGQGTSCHLHWHTASCPGSIWALGHTWVPPGLVCWTLAFHAPATHRLSVTCWWTRAHAQSHLGYTLTCVPRHTEHLREGV